MPIGAHDPRKKLFLAALEKSLGVVTPAARQCGIDRHNHYVWLKEDPEYLAAVESLVDVALDYAESKLHKQIEDGEVSSTIFYLKCKGKKRGYIERTEVSPVNPDGSQFSGITNEQLLAAIQQNMQKIDESK